MGNSDLLEYVQKCLEIQYIDKQINKKQSLCSSYKLECQQVATTTFILWHSQNSIGEDFF